MIMFEYIAKNGKKVTINPKMITLITESDTDGETLIYTAEDPDPIRIRETYEKVSKDFQTYMYSITTITSI